MKFILASMLSIPFAFYFTSPSQASDWGCEVLLCAASSNPSWHDVASCRPPDGETDHGDEEAGVFVADLPGSWYRKAGI